MLILAAVVVRRKIRFPSHAVIQRQSLVHLPIVLGIQRIIKLPRIEPILRALCKGHGTSHHKIGENYTRYVSVKRRRTHGIDAGEIVQPLLIDGAAEPELMRTLDPTDVVDK